MKPNTLHEAFEHFSDRHRCIDYLVKIRWPNGIECPTCGSTDLTTLTTRNLWQCKTRHPKRQFSVKVGTILECSPIPLSKWLVMTWMLMNCRNGISSHEAARTIGITQKSAWFMLHRIRHAMHDDPLGKLWGDVEADETYVGGKSHNMHLGKRKLRITRPGNHDKVPVLGILKRGGKVRAMVVKNHKRPTLHFEVRKHVEPGSTVYTDALRSYNGLTEYVHQKVDHAQKFVHGKIHTNGLENFWSLLKRMLKGTYISVRPDHLMAYVAEQVFRFNHRVKFTEEMRFAAVLTGMSGKRLTYAQLIARV